MPLTQLVKYADKQFQLLDLREIHPSGNKYFKLKLNIEQAVAERVQTILSFGGAWSNHIHALATRGAELKMPTIGVIRGERPAQLSPMLQEAEANGMKLHFVSREQYRNALSPEFLEALRHQFGDFYLIPEGGSNALGVEGAGEIVELLEGLDYQRLFVAVGTGGTLAGIARRLPEGKHITGVCVLKGEDTLTGSVNTLVGQTNNWSIDFSGAYGGYARCPDYLKNFITDFEQQTNITLEPVYTAKMIYRLLELMERQPELNSHTTIALHTGGLQGRRGFGF